MPTSWTKLPKVSGTQYSKVFVSSKESWDDPFVAWDDSGVAWDGNQTGWTKLPKPTIVQGLTTWAQVGSLTWAQSVPLTWASSGSTWTNIPKAT